MTIEQILKSDAATLEKMTDTELHAYFEPMLRVTRPDRAAAEREKNGDGGKKQVARNGNGLSPDKAAKFKAMAEQMGIDLGDTI